MKIAYILPSLDHKGPILIAQSIVNELAIEVEFIILMLLKKSNLKQKP
jgi:hypothetical protein